MAKTWALALHGGAGPSFKDNYEAEEAHFRELLKRGGAALEAGANAIDVACEMVEALEDCGFHIAGRGASPNRNGEWELDASIMDGANRTAGAVAALRGYKSPIRTARAVMDHSPHVMLVGKGASAFAAERGLKAIKDPKKFFTPAVDRPYVEGELQHGTVGAVVCDDDGQLAAATSTGGLLNKTPGRVGDTPILGAGTWADERVAVSCTGQGEYFMRAGVASDVTARIRYGKIPLKEAVEGALQDMAYLGGEGGLIAVDCLGKVSMSFNSQIMKRGSLNARGELFVATGK